MKLLAPGFRVPLFLLSLTLLACGPSQADFDRMKQQLQTVTADRDNVKAQLETAQGKVTSLQQQVTTLEQAATAKPADDAGKTASKAAGKKHARAKSSRRAKRR